IVSPVNKSCPSAVTTLAGIGGALLIAWYPTLPRTANDTSITNPSAIQSFLYGIYESSVRLFSAQHRAAQKPRARNLIPIPTSVLRLGARDRGRYDFCHGDVRLFQRHGGRSSGRSLQLQ